MSNIADVAQVHNYLEGSISKRPIWLYGSPRTSNYTPSAKAKAKASPLFPSLPSQTPLFLRFFSKLKSPNNTLFLSLKMSNKLDMSLDDMIRNSRRSGPHNVNNPRGRGRASGPGPDRRFATRNLPRTAPYYPPQARHSLSTFLFVLSR